MARAYLKRVKNINRAQIFRFLSLWGEPSMDYLMTQNDLMISTFLLFISEFLLEGNIGY